MRYSGTDDELSKLAADYAFDLACGHSFIIIMRDAYPVNVLPRLKDVPEVANIFVATANPITGSNNRLGDQKRPKSAKIR